MANAAPAFDEGPIFQAAGQEWNVDPTLLRSLAGQETGALANPDGAVSTAGARGRMQIMPATAQELGVTDPTDRVQSIYGAAKYMSQLLDRYQGQPDPVSTAVGAYNAGPSRMDAYLSGQGGLPAETVAYIPSVARRYQAITGSQQQAPGQTQIPAQAAPSSNDAATANLDTTVARLRSGGAQAAPAPTTMAGASSDAVTGSDPFAQAVSAARALTSANPAPAPSAPQRASAIPSQPATGGTSPDFFAQALAASQKAMAGSGVPAGAATPATTLGTPPPASNGPQAETGIMGI